VPLKTIFNYLDDVPTLGIALRNLGGNIMIFVPLGFFIPLLHRTSKWKTVLVVALVVSLTFEIIQGVFKVGIFDVDDILLNALGTMIGYWVFVCIKSVVLKRQTSFEKYRH
jgi:glycopeptide antibiotics resistance protein